jgi:hypothetical protein
MEFPQKRNEPYMKPQGTRPTKVIASAILQDGHVWTGKRHPELIKQVMQDTGKYVSQDQQGFWTDDDRFVMRTAAAALARRYGQVGEEFKRRELLSEDVW